MKNDIEKDLTDLDKAATEGYQAGLKKHRSMPPQYTGFELLTCAWRIGNIRGLEEGKKG